MLSRQFVRSGQSRAAVRWFTRNSIMRESNQSPKHSDSTKDDVLAKHMYRVTNFDKRILVWVKRYPSIAEVPEKVTVDCLLTARSKARIKTCNYMIVVTIIGCIIAAFLGKRQAERGENLFKMRQDWYEEMLEKDKNK
ncbi:protein FAM162A [Harpegnathos saltator]|nr:protein FAM162A [Harpegnathos saltator]